MNANSFKFIRIIHNDFHEVSGLFKVRPSVEFFDDFGNTQQTNFVTVHESQMNTYKALTNIGYSPELCRDI